MVVAPLLFRGMTTEMRWLVASLWLSLLASCNEETSTGGGGGGGSPAAKPSGSGGGFSADLAKEFAGSGSGDVKGGSGDAKAGSGDVKAGGDMKAGSGETVAKAGSGDMKAGSGDAKAGSGDAKAGSGDAKAGSGTAKDPIAKAGSADVKTSGPDPKEPVAKAGSADIAPRVATGPGPLIQSAGATPKRVTVPAELAAIKFGMLPNWERDVQDAGTLSLGVKIPGRGESAIFVFRYGYEDPGAPADRDAYKKWLADKRLLTVRQDRQAGSSWFLEGNDGSGNPAFRVVVNWGGKKLVCYGSLYKDAESNKLGDLRDQTIIQAKQICETVAL
jgi:hypothetical protein